jgi:hypothetical protein
MKIAKSSFLIMARVDSIGVGMLSGLTTWKQCKNKQTNKKQPDMIKMYKLLLI